MEKQSQKQPSFTHLPTINGKKTSAHFENLIKNKNHGSQSSYQQISSLTDSITNSKSQSKHESHHNQHHYLSHYGIDQQRLSSSAHNLSYQTSMTMKSKSPSCKQLFGQTLTKKKIPISMLSVTKYKELLAITNNDPKHPDISLHIPIDNDETQNLIRSLNSVAQVSQQQQQQQKGRKILGAANAVEEKSVFFPFRDGKEINRHEFIRLHQENPSYQNLDFHELYLDGKTGGAGINGQQFMNNQNGKNNNNTKPNEDEVSSGSDDEQEGNLFRLSNNYGYRGSVGFGRGSSMSLQAKAANKIQLSLIHNKDIQYQLTNNLHWESKSQYDELQKQIQLQADAIKHMPKVRQYPIYKKKQIGNNGNNTNDGDKNENKEIANKDENGQKIASSARDNNNNNNNQNNVAEVVEPVSGKQTDENDNKKVRFTGNSIINENYQVYWYSFEQNFWKPDVRQSQTLVADAKKSYLFGGIGHELYNSLVELDMESFKWKIITQEGPSGNAPTARFGHSCNIYKRMLVFFGGEYHTMQNNITLKDCLLDVYTFNLDTNTWKFINCIGGPLQPRKNHAAAILGRNLIVQGGVNNKDQVLKDMWTLDLGTMQWSEVSVTGEIDMCCHQSVPVYQSQRQGKITMYKLNEIKITKWGASILQEGLYYFGGKNSKGEVLGDLRILRTDCKPMQWIRPETKGTQPKARYSHSMDYSQELNFLIIHGGKNDNDPDVYFGDTFILNVDDFNWIRVAVHGKPPPPRSDHSSCIFESKLIIFGGINLDGFLPPCSSILELDNVLSGKLQEREETSINVRDMMLSPNELRKPIDAIENLQQQMLQQQQSNISNQSKKAQLKNSSNGNGEQQHNIKIDHIPFQERIKEMETDMDDQKILVNSLNYQNFKSFLPIPRFTPQPYSRSMSKKNSFLKQPVLYNPQTNQAITPQSSLSKSIVYE